jgi:hypothetical protein
MSALVTPIRTDDLAVMIFTARERPEHDGKSGETGRERSA